MASDFWKETIMTLELFTPVGRQVQGNILLVNTTDRNGNPLLTLDKKPKTSVFFAMAFDKTPGVVDWWMEPHPMWRQIYDAARLAFPNDFDPNTGLLHPHIKNFAFKIMDGDGYDDDGKLNSGKPGMAGCWIMKFASSFPARLTHGNTYIIDPNIPKNGWFYRVLFDIKPNDGPKHGLYLNPQGVELIGAGQEISGGIDAVAKFQEAGAAALPAGATALPAGFGGTAGTAPNMRQPAPLAAPGATMHPPASLGVAPVGMAPAPLAAPGAPLVAPAPLGQPNHSFVTNAGAPLAAPGMLAPPPVVAPTYGPGPNAQGHQPAAWLGMGHAPEALIAGGMIVRTN
jgi:hypothetical protein